MKTNGTIVASLRIQTNTENKGVFGDVSPERYAPMSLSLCYIKWSMYTCLTNRDRAFADYVFGSLILHFFCVNFIN